MDEVNKKIRSPSVKSASNRNDRNKRNGGRKVEASAKNTRARKPEPVVNIVLPVGVPLSTVLGPQAPQGGGDVGGDKDRDPRLDASTETESDDDGTRSDDGLGPSLEEDLECDERLVEVGTLASRLHSRTRVHIVEPETAAELASISLISFASSLIFGRKIGGIMALAGLARWILEEKEVDVRKACLTTPKSDADMVAYLITRFPVPDREKIVAMNMALLGWAKLNRTWGQAQTTEIIIGSLRAYFKVTSFRDLASTKNGPTPSSLSVSVQRVRSSDYLERVLDWTFGMVTGVGTAIKSILGSAVSRSAAAGLVSLTLIVFTTRFMVSLGGSFAKEAQQLQKLTRDFLSRLVGLVEPSLRKTVQSSRGHMRK